MGGRCTQCNTNLSLMENYGTRDNILCFNCANSLTCSECGIKVDVNDQIKSNAKIYCPPCHEASSQKTISTADIDNVNDIDESTGNDTGFFAMEKNGVKKGVAGGVMMMLIAVVWFVVGYAAGFIFYYPPILFIIGLFAFFKGLFTGNLSGQKEES